MVVEFSSLEIFKIHLDTFLDCPLQTICLNRGVGLDDHQRPLPIPTILWLCEKCENKLLWFYLPKMFFLWLLFRMDRCKAAKLSILLWLCFLAFWECLWKWFLTLRNSISSSRDLLLFCSGFCVTWLHALRYHKFLLYVQTNEHSNFSYHLWKMTESCLQNPNEKNKLLWILCGNIKILMYA